MTSEVSVNEKSFFFSFLLKKMLERSTRGDQLSAIGRVKQQTHCQLLTKLVEMSSITSMFETSKCLLTIFFFFFDFHRDYSEK